MSFPERPKLDLKRVEWRVDGQPKNHRSRFVPHLTAAIVSEMLDDWVGPNNWSDFYRAETMNGKPVVWCELALFDKEKSEWVIKRDVGKPSNFESEKGAVSDALKRAASLKWGVGREVYFLPNVWAPVDVEKDNQGKDRAYPNAQTRPAILAELKKQGYNLDDVVVAGEEEDDTPATAAATANPYDIGGGKSQVVEVEEDLPFPVSDEPVSEIYDEERGTFMAKPATLQKLGAVWASAIDSGHTTEDTLRHWLKEKYGVPSRKLLTEVQAREAFNILRRTMAAKGAA